MGSTRPISLLPDRETWPTQLDGESESGGCLLGCSGGRDSVALLHALHGALPKGRLRVIHVDHGLHGKSANWARQVEALCQSLDVPCVVEGVVVERTGEGPEAAARRARYAAFRKHLGRNEVLALAHHRDDQIETLLMRLLSGAVPSQLAGMPVMRNFGEACLWRPLLTRTRAEITAYAEMNCLSWIDDPANDDETPLRNRIRQHLLPAIDEISTDGRAGIATSAALLAQQNEVALALADLDLERVGTGQESLSIQALQALGMARRNNVLRHWLNIQTGANMPAVVAPLFAAQSDRQPLARIGVWELRRYRDEIFRMRSLADPPRDEIRLNGNGEIALPEGCGKLTVQGIAGDDLVLRWQKGGERLQLPDRAQHSSVKKLWQQAGVPPWVRRRCPLLYRGEKLLAVADRWADAGLSKAHPELKIVWKHDLVGDPHKGTGAKV